MGHEGAATFAVAASRRVFRLGFSRVARGTGTARTETSAAVRRHGAEVWRVRAEVRRDGADAARLGFGAQAAAAASAGELEDTGWPLTAKPGQIGNLASAFVGGKQGWMSRIVVERIMRECDCEWIDWRR